MTLERSPGACVTAGRGLIHTRWLGDALDGLSASASQRQRAGFHYGSQARGRWQRVQLQATGAHITYKWLIGCTWGLNIAPRFAGLIGGTGVP